MIIDGIEVHPCIVIDSQMMIGVAQMISSHLWKFMGHPSGPLSEATTYGKPKEATGIL